MWWRSENASGWSFGSCMILVEKYFCLVGFFWGGVYYTLFHHTPVGFSRSCDFKRTPTHQHPTSQPPPPRSPPLYLPPSSSPSSSSLDDHVSSKRTDSILLSFFSTRPSRRDHSEHSHPPRGGGGVHDVRVSSADNVLRNAPCLPLLLETRSR